MIHKYLITIGLVVQISLLALAGEIHPATTPTPPETDSSLLIHGVVTESRDQAPLPYANIYVMNKHRGAVSNELGQYVISLAGIDAADTVRFQYIGYKTVMITVAQLSLSPDVAMEENIINLSEILVFGSDPDPRDIVKKVIENKDRNYKRTTSRRQVFVRERYNQDITGFEIKYKKSSIPKIDRDAIDLVEEKVPRHFTSFTDFLGNLYINKNPDDSVTLKVDPLRTVSLKEEDISDLEQFATIFENLFAETGDEEYWKVKSGLFGSKIDTDEPEVDSLRLDTLKVDAVRDSLDKNRRETKYYKYNVRHKQRFVTLDDKVNWEFLYRTGRYKYTLTGGTRVNGEEVYIIDFEPRHRGLYQGRLFISTQTYALVSADFAYAPGKVGLDVQLLGIGYSETGFGGSVFFEKQDSTYALKYFSYKSANKASINRSLALIKKRKRWLFDKTLMEIKVRLDMAVSSDESVEYLVLDQNQIPDSEFAAFEEPEKMDIIFVDQYDDKLWEGYTIIEPIKQMKEYRKQDWGGRK